MIDPAFIAELKRELTDHLLFTGPLRNTVSAPELEALLDLVDTVTARYAEPRGPFAVGTEVKHREAPTLIGKVVGTVGDEGELHTVWVLWDGQGSRMPYSPRELIEVPQ